MEPDGQHHIGIPASMSNRVGAIADFNQEVARAAGHFAAQASWICCSCRPLLGSLIENSVSVPSDQRLEAATVALSSSREEARLESKAACGL